MNIRRKLWLSKALRADSACCVMLNVTSQAERSIRWLRRGRIEDSSPTLCRTFPLSRSTSIPFRSNIRKFSLIRWYHSTSELFRILNHFRGIYLLRSNMLKNYLKFVLCDVVWNRFGILENSFRHYTTLENPPTSQRITLITSEILQRIIWAFWGFAYCVKDSFESRKTILKDS